MRLHEPISQDDVKPSRTRFNLELYYYERVGSKYYLRITPFALILMIVAMLVGFTILILDARNHPTQEINTNISVPNPSPYSPNNNIIWQAPPPTSQSSKQPKVTLPSPPVPPSPNRNINVQ